LIIISVVFCVYTAAAAPGPITVSVCAASNNAGDCCGAFSDTIQVKFCPGTAAGGNSFYVYRLKNVAVCDMAYCAVRTMERVDANNGTHIH